MPAKKPTLLEHLRDPDSRGRLLWFLLIALLALGAARWTAYALGEPFWQARWQRTTWPARLSYPISTQDSPLLAVVLGLALGALLAFPLVAAARSRARNGVALALATMALGPLPFVVSMPGTRGWPPMLRGMILLLICIALLGLWMLGPLVLMRRHAKRTPPLIRSAIGHMGYVAYFVAVTVTSPGIVYHLPWMLAIAISWLGVAAVIHVRQRTDWIARWLSPVAGGMLLVGSVVFFYVGVGADEREFPPLQIDCEPHRLFRRGRVQRMDEDAVRRALGQSDHRDLTGGGLVPIEAVMKAEQSLLIGPRINAVRRLDAFLATFGKSRHAAHALALRGRILDTRLHTDLFKYYTLHFYESWPRKETWPIWQQLADEHTGTPWAFLARVRLAQLLARQGEWNDALRRLPAQEHAPPLNGLTAADRQILQEAWIDALLLRQRIVANRDDPRYGDAPLKEFLGVDPQQWHTPGDLAETIPPDSLLADNAALLTERLAQIRLRCEALKQNYIDEVAATRVVDRTLRDAIAAITEIRPDKLPKVDRPKARTLTKAADAENDEVRRSFHAQRFELRSAYDRKDRDVLLKIARDPRLADGDAACEALLLLARQRDAAEATPQLLAEAIETYRKILRRFGPLPLARFARHRLETLTGGAAREDAERQGSAQP